MIVRDLDINGDWTFGKGKNNYNKNQDAIAQNIQTRLLSFLGDCFFDIQAGIDWFNLLGGKNELAINLAVSAVLLNTQNVTGIKEVSVSLDTARKLTISYQVQTTYSILTSSFQYDLNGLV